MIVIKGIKSIFIYKYESLIRVCLIKLSCNSMKHNEDVHTWGCRIVL